MDLRIGVVSDVTQISSADWNRLVESCPDSTVFQRYEWLRAWTLVFATASRPCIVTAHRGGELVGAAPLFEGNDGAGATSIQFLGAGHSDYCVFPAQGGCPQIVHALLDAVDRLVSRRVRIDLSEVPQFSTLSSCLAERAARSSEGLILRSHTACPRLRIRGNAAGVAAVLAKRSVRRNDRRLARLGEVTIEHHTHRDHIDPMLESFFDRHVERCKLTEYSSLFERRPNRDFYRALVREFDGSGQLVFSAVKVDNHAVAEHFGFLSSGDLLWYKPTFDVRLRQYSPGAVLLKALIELACVLDCGALDFTRGDEPFKSRFASDTAFNDSYLWIRDRVARRAYELERGARAVAKRLRRSVPFLSRSSRT